MPMLHRVLHFDPPMMENFAFATLEDALDDLIDAWEDGDVVLTGIIGFLNESGVRAHGIASDDDVTEDTPVYILEGAGILARGLISGNLAASERLRAAIALHAGILVLPIADPWFEALAGICERQADVVLPLGEHPDPVVNAAVERWLRRSS